MGQYDLYIKGAQVLREKFPDLWKLAQPRHYVSPQGYANIKCVSTSLVGQMLMTVSKTQEEYDKVMITTTCIMWKLVEQGVPIFYIGQNLIEDLAQSEPPKDMALSELEWPHEAMIFMLPEQFQQQYFRRCVPFICIARQPAEDAYPPPNLLRVLTMKRCMKIDIRTKFLVLFSAPIFYTPMKPVDYAISCKAEDTVSSVVSDTVFYDGTDDNRKGWLSPDDIPTREEDIELNTKIFLTGLWIMMLLNAEPQHVEMGTITCARKAKSHDGKADLWSPNMIGRSYARKELGGTHASPRAHIRRGHWHHIVYGAGRAGRRLTWIKRHFVGVKDTAP